MHMSTSVIMQRQDHLSIWPKWACLWVNGLLNHVPVWFTLNGIHISVDLFTPVVMQRQGHSPICPIKTCPLAKKCKNLHQCGPDIAQYLWNCWTDFLPSNFYIIVQTYNCAKPYNCPFIPYVYPWAKDYSLKPLDRFSPKFYKIALTCTCAPSESFTHSPHMGVPMDGKLLSLQPL